MRGLFLFFLIFPFLASCNLGYYIKQGYGQLKLIVHREPIEAILDDPGGEKQLKRKIQLVQKIKTFCEKDLGLDISGSYDTFVKVNGQVIAQVVSACPKDKLEPYEWNFPIVGHLPYKGFFERKDAIKEKARLDAMGYDTCMQGVLAYSTLGWLSDPILSTMTSLDDVSLAYVIIHELTHQTLFIKDRVDFNERVATFIGHIGTILFFEQQEGKKSERARSATLTFEDDRTFALYIQQAIKRLESLYAMKISRQEKLERRKMIFASILEDFARIQKRLQTSSYDSFGKGGLNNAVLLAYRRYIGHLDDLNRAYLCMERDVKRLLALLITFQSKEKDPDVLLSAWIKSKGC